jgi:hypothetical protein
MALERYISLFGGAETTRFAYLRWSSLKRALQDDLVVNAVMRELELELDARSHDERVTAIVARIDRVRQEPKSEWNGHSAPNIFAALVLRADNVSSTYVLKHFSELRSEAVLLHPISAWCRAHGYETHTAIPLGGRVSDIVGVRSGILPALVGLRDTVAVEVKHADIELHRELEQISTFRDHVHRAYLACTPFMAAEYLLAHRNRAGVTRWNFDLLDDQVRGLGLGLLLVDGKEVIEHVRPRACSPSADRRKALKAVLAETTRR